MPRQLMSYFTTVVYKKINKSLAKFQVEFVGWMQTKLQAAR